MTFSIVIPTYNGSKYVEKAILSVLNQTRQADEIIISDDNSTDETLTICKKYADRIKIYHNPKGPSGFVNGWNNAIAYATCDYISILHQDDWLDSSFLKEAEDALEAYPEAKHLFAPCNYINGEGNIIRSPDYCDSSVKLYSGIEYIHAYQTIGKPHIHRCPGVLTHREIFKECMYRAEAGHIADDDFFYQVGKHTQVVGILKPLAAYREHASSETGHLKHLELVKRLANDYIYQVKQWKDDSFMSTEAYNYFVYWAKHYTYEEFYWSLKSNNKESQEDARQNIKELEKDGIFLSRIKLLFIQLRSILTQKWMP